MNIVSINAIFAWKGSKSDEGQKKAILDLTDLLLKKDPKKNVLVQLVFEGEETILFKGLFKNWPDLNWREEEEKKNILKSIQDSGNKLFKIIQGHKRERSSSEKKINARSSVNQEDTNK